jgi:hypothetical protein
MLHQDPGGSSTGTEAPYIAGIDVTTGKEAFRVAPSDYSMSPCAGPDGAFYGRPGYEHYGRTMYRVSPAGVKSTINLGMNGNLFGIESTGHVLRRDWAYNPSDKGRIALIDGDGGELFSVSFFTGASNSYIAASNGTHVLVAGQGKLTHYSLTK